MHRFFPRVILVVALSLLVTGCGDNPSTVAPEPTAGTVTNTYSGILTKNGAFTHPFTVTGIGGISAQLVSLAPDSIVPVGMGIGTWNGSSCQIVLANDVTIQGSVVVGEASAPGDFCVRIYDAAGTVSEPRTYTVEVTHR